MNTPDLRPLRYLSAADVMAAMPDLDARLDLAERTMTALVADAELPPKIGIHPRPDDSAVHAMPAFLRGADGTGRDDRIGMKWVAIFPSNNAIGLPAMWLGSRIPVKAMFALDICNQAPIHKTEFDQIVAAHTEGRQFRFLGEPRVNVLELNLDLDNRKHDR